MKSNNSKKITHQLRHAPLATEIDKPSGKLRKPIFTPSSSSKRSDECEENEEEGDDSNILYNTMADNSIEFISSNKIMTNNFKTEKKLNVRWTNDNDFDDGDYEEDISENNNYSDDDDEVDGLIEFDEDGNVKESGDLLEAEEALVDKFLQADRFESRTLADIIMDKLQEKKKNNLIEEENTYSLEQNIPAKVVEVYTSVGKMLQHYRSGKLPKALKMLPHLKNWEEILWLTRPDEWSPAATYASTRIFASNLNEKMAQRFMNMVLLEKCRDDIRTNKKLNYYYYLAIKKALYKPSAFYKGFLLPLAQSGTCTLREATIIGSALTKLSIPGIHSAAVLLRLSELSYSGSTSMFIKILLNKKYALPRRVIDALLNHFLTFERETRTLPVVWHQSLLVFIQRYKFELSGTQRDKIKHLAKVQFHYQITSEINRELTVNVRSKF